MDFSSDIITLSPLEQRASSAVSLKVTFINKMFCVQFQDQVSSSNGSVRPRPRVGMSLLSEEGAEGAEGAVVASFPPASEHDFLA